MANPMMGPMKPSIGDMRASRFAKCCDDIRKFHPAPSHMHNPGAIPFPFPFRVIRPVLVRWAGSGLSGKGSVKKSATIKMTPCAVLELTSAQRRFDHLPDKLVSLVHLVSAASIQFR